MISAVLTCFKRQYNLQEQINSCLLQSIKISEIIIWNNGEHIEKDQLKVNAKTNLIVINSSDNTGVWSRFSVALICKNHFILVLDDDTIPGIDFCKNCLDSFHNNPGLYGSRGLRFLSKNNYEPYDEFGWSNPNDSIVEVDIVGHSWFFPKKYLSFFWNENLANNISYICGEDIHFSYSIQKYGDLKTFVPPHTLDKPKSWGSNPSISLSIGGDKNAISQSKNAISKFEKAFKFYRSKGFKLIIVDKLESYTYLKHYETLSFKKKLMIYLPFIYKITKKLFR